MSIRQPRSALPGPCRAAAFAFEVASFGALAGSAFCFERTPAGWMLVQSFEGSALDPGDLFGWTLDLEGDGLAIGAPNQLVTGFPTPGAVHLDSFGAGPHLVADTPAVSLAQDSAQGLQLGACTGHAGDLYLVCGAA